MWGAGRILGVEGVLINNPASAGCEQKLEARETVFNGYVFSAVLIPVIKDSQF
jgi:hypothetical protein